MSHLIMVNGFSGSGKSRSIAGLDPKQTYLIQSIPKPLPLKNSEYFETIVNKDGKIEKQGNRKVIFDNQFQKAITIANSNPKVKIEEIFQDKVEITKQILFAVSDNLPHIKTIVIDDAGYFMGYEIMARARDKSFDKYTGVANNMWQIMSCAQSLRDDLRVFVMFHVETTDGVLKAKTAGKMIDNVITLEGLCTTVLFTSVERDNGKYTYSFITNSDGTTTAKSPEGMFDSYKIPNDLGFVLGQYNKLYN